jgi:hypothetical protein
MPDEAVRTKLRGSAGLERSNLPSTQNGHFGATKQCKQCTMEGETVRTKLYGSAGFERSNLTSSKTCRLSVRRLLNADLLRQSSSTV